MEKSIHDLIVNLKDVRSTSGISYDDIVDRVSQNGEAISITTVRKVFAEGSEDNGTFKWKTLQPIARCLLGFDEAEMYNPSNARLYYEQLEAARSDIDYREKEKQTLLTVQEEHKETISGLRRQIKFQRVVLACLVFTILAFAIIFLIIDMTDPTIGYLHRLSAR